jgi:hypothetical protein
MQRNSYVRAKHYNSKPLVSLRSRRDVPSRHGSPSPNAKSTVEFIILLMRSIPDIISVTDSIKRRLAAGDEESDKIDICLAEIPILLDFWSVPTHAALIEKDSYMVTSSCAVDVLIDRNFELARVFVRTGAFVRQWRKQGRDAHVGRLPQPNSLARATGRDAALSAQDANRPRYCAVPSRTGSVWLRTAPRRRRERTSPGQDGEMWRVRYTEAANPARKMR